MEFPEQSVKKARDIVAKYKRRSSSKLENAANLFDNYFIHINYGFSEAIKKGNCGLHFHEIDKEADCFTYLGVAYLVAREAGLSPRMWRGIGIKDVPEGADPTYIETFDHNFITVEIGKNKTLMLDKQMGLWGITKFNKKNHVLEVYHKKRGKLTYRHYAHLSEITPTEFLEKLEENRSPEGGRKVLETTQRVTGAGERQIYLGFYPETQEIQSSIRIPLTLFGPEEHTRAIVMDLNTKVAEDGDYDFRKGSISCYHVFNLGWREHERSQIHLIVPVSDAEKVWEIWEPLVKEMGRKAPIQDMFYLRLMDLLKKGGFNDNFEVKPRSKASKIIRINSLEENLIGFKRAEKKIIEDYIERAASDSISFKSFLRRTIYTVESDKVKSKSNPNGFIFSKDNHLELLKLELEKYKKSTERLCDSLNESAEIRSGLKEGNRQEASRAVNISLEKEKTASYFDQMAGIRSSSYPIGFNMAADWELFKRQFNLDRISVNNLMNGLKKRDLKRGAQERLFDLLTQFLVLKDSLFLASYKSGLTKILDRRS